MRGYHTKWSVPDEHRESAEYIEAGARIALGQAVYDRRTALGISQTELARRAGGRGGDANAASPAPPRRGTRG
jgi:hypothetical protein